MRDRQYNQKLTSKKAAEGMKIIMHNAKSLLADAELLFQNKRFERAFALSILSIEESGKLPILRQILLEDNQKELNKLWKNFRTHAEKNWGLLFLSIPINNETKLDHIRPLFDGKADHGHEFDRLKQLSFYTELYKDGKWTSPKEVVSEQLADSVLKTTKLFVEKDLMAITTEPELELWVKYLKPVWKKDMQSMKAALITCYKEAERVGVLAGSHKADELIKFL